MNGELNWKAFEYKFSSNLQKAFERLAYQLFCREFNISKGLFAYYNQKAIETNPFIDKDRGLNIGFQAKYYESPSIDAKRTSDLIKEIKKAKNNYVEINCLYFYVSRPFSESPLNGELITKGQHEIKALEKELNIKIRWVVPSHFEKILNDSINKDLFDYYFNVEELGSTIGDYYETIVKRIEKKPINSMYGEISLKDGYIEPFISVNGSEKSVQDYISEWVTDISRRDRIVIIHGEPGHGKSSMCLKMVYEFYKNNQLADMFDNVFCFSLNPVGTDAANSNPLKISSLFRWEDEDHNVHSLKGTKILNNALIFLDAYDELLECVNDVELSELIKCVEDVQKQTNSRIIITSRTMAIIKDIRDNHFLGSSIISAYSLVPVSKDVQLKWLDTYKSQCVSEDMLDDWDDYISKYKKNIAEERYNQLMGIPIIFRMIVTNRISTPREDANIVQIYDELFDSTWRRHPRVRGVNDKIELMNALQKLSLMIYGNDTDTAIVNDSYKSPWLFSYYTKSNGTSKVGFYHPSFYQYFLAKEVLSWYKRYARKENLTDENRQLNEFKNALKYLGRRKLDITTLDFIGKMYCQDYENELINVSFKKGLEILKKTDGIIQGFHNGATDCSEQYDILEKVNPLERANNVFWNIISISSSCGYPVVADKVNVSSLRLFDLNGCLLNNAVFMNEDLNGAKMRAADLRDATLNGVDLSEADLSSSEMSSSNLKDAILYGANLGSTNMHRAILCNANLSEACLSHANLSESDLSSADLRGAILNGADLNGAILRDAFLNNAHLRAVDMSGKVDLEHADLRGADLQNSNLSGAILNDADLRGADLKNADLREAFLFRADLRNAQLSGALLNKAKMKGVKLVGAYLQNVRIDAENLDLLRKSGINVAGMFTME